MGVLADRDRAAIVDMFAEAAEPVEVRIVVPGTPEAAGRTGFRAAMAEVSELVPLISVREVGAAEADGIAVRVPGVALFRPDGTDLRVRMAGMPSGYEFASLLAAVADAARQEDGLQPASLEALGTLKSDVHIMVFTTPT